MVANIYKDVTDEWVIPFDTNLWYKCNLCDLKIFWPFNNRLMMQDKESTSNGEQRNNIFIISVKSFALKIKLVRYDPKKRLPASPINTFDGYQFKRMNPNNAPNIWLR